MTNPQPDTCANGGGNLDLTATGVRVDPLCRLMVHLSGRFLAPEFKKYFSFFFALTNNKKLVYIPAENRRQMEPSSTWRGRKKTQREENCFSSFEKIVSTEALLYSILLKNNRSLLFFPVIICLTRKVTFF